MIDWILSVFRAFPELSLNTFFIAVNIYDKFITSIKNNEKKLNESHYHLVGIASAIIAIKYEYG
jgi:hypothetical protein